MYTAEEYRNLMISVITMAIREAEQDAERERHWGDDLNNYYNNGYIAGLNEAKHQLEASEFLSNPDYKD